MTAKQRKPLSASLEEPELTPEMEAFRKGAVVSEKVEQAAETSSKPNKQKNRKLVVELEAELYDAFATVCFQKRMKMAQVVRAFVEGYVDKN